MYYEVVQAPDCDQASIVFHDASWDFYEAVLREYDQQPSRVSFDGRTLEIMTISTEHEAYRFALAEMIGNIAEKYSLRMLRRGSATLKLAAVGKGLAPDLCYWIQNEAAVRTVKRLDLAVHPAPDLVVEIDITHATVDRESIYSALGVAEMWHFDTQTWLTAWKREDQGWSRIDQSQAIPMIRPSDLSPFLQMVMDKGDHEALTAFRAWLRDKSRQE